MSNLDRLVFRTATIAISVNNFSTKKEEEVKKAQSAETVLHRGKQCSKGDIENLLNRIERQKPLEPGPDDCCGDGCNPCVFDVYERKNDIYEEKKTEYESLLLEFEDDLP